MTKFLIPLVLLSLVACKSSQVVTEAKNEVAGVTSSELSKSLGITPATVSGLIKSMEADGYLERVTSTTDRRSFALVVTAKGHQVLGEAKARWYPMINSFWRQFSDQEMSVLDGYVQRMNSYLSSI